MKGQESPPFTLGICHDPAFTRIIVQKTGKLLLILPETLLQCPAGSPPPIAGYLDQSGALMWGVRVRVSPLARGGCGRRLLQALVGAPRTPGPGARRLSPSLAAQPASGAAVIGTGRRGGCPSGGSGLAHARCRGAWGDRLSRPRLCKECRMNRSPESGGSQRLRSAGTPRPGDPEQTSVSARQNHPRVVASFYRKY